MGNDTRLGLVVGMAIVIAIAVTYFPKNADRAKASNVVPSLPAATAGER